MELISLSSNIDQYGSIMLTIIGTLIEEVCTRAETPALLDTARYKNIVALTQTLPPVK
jgi:hypothetical protein